MGHLRKWLKYQQYLPKQLQTPHSTSARACIYYLGHRTRLCEPSDTEQWEQGWGASAAELMWGAEWCQSHISVPSCLSLAEASQRPPVPALLLEGDGLPPIFCWGVSLCIWMFAEIFFPKTRQILMLRSGSNLRSHGEKEHDHPVVIQYWTIFRQRSSEKDSSQGWRTSIDSHALF